MEIELLPVVNLPEGQAVITCEGVKICTKESVKIAPKEKEKESVKKKLSAAELDKIADDSNCCRLKRVIDNEEKMDCNELIAYWMMEGCLGHVDSVKEAYKKGHDLFMDFKYVKMPRFERYEKEMDDRLISDTTYKRYRNFKYSTLGLGFVDVFDNFHEEAPKFGDLVPDNGALRSLTHKEEKSSCLLLDGNQQGRHVLEFFNESLKHFAYFNPRANFLQSALKPTDLKPNGHLNLSVLVLRGCEFLEEIDPCIGQMTELTLLEISHSSSIKTLPDIFKKTTNLRSLNLSYLAIKSLPKNSFGKLIHVRWIILRGCSKLTELPSTRDMSKLEVIDLYGATSLTKLSTTNFRKHHNFRLIDLSNTQATRVPCLFDFSEPSATSITHLFLRNCPKIYVFDIVEKLVHLEVLDVSGSEHLKQISIHTLERLVVLDLSRTGLSSLKEESFKDLKKLKVLNLSETNISSMPNISCLSKLLRLTVQGCTSLETLKLEGLNSLQFLDVSGCKKLKKWENLALRQCPCLLSVNLSGTCIGDNAASSSNQGVEQPLGIPQNPDVASSSNQGVEHPLGLPQNPDAASSSNQGLEQPLGLPQNPDAASSSIQYLEPLPGLLQMLDLSNTFVEVLPPMSQYTSLKQLLLAGCSKLLSVRDLHCLTELEVLDLSGTEITNELLQNAPSSLRKLLLKDCSKIKEPLPLASLTQLEELDLRGSNVEKLPEHLASMPNLKCLRLPHKMNITGVESDDWRKMKNFRLNELYWDQLDFFKKHVKVQISSDAEQSMSMKPSDASHLFRLVDNEDKWEGYFKQFQFSVSPKEENEYAVIHFGGADLVFKGHHPVARKEPYVQLQSRSVEIHGFSSFPEDTQSGLKQAVNVALVGNSFVSSLSDEYFKHMEAMKVCWINNCTKMKSILGDQNAGFWGGLETLVMSNLPILESFFLQSKNVPSPSTVPINLKHLYIDCCPILDKIISPSHMPESLETLHIKFCDKLVDVCGEIENTSNVGDQPAAATGGNPSSSGAGSSGNTSSAADEPGAGSTSREGDEPVAVSEIGGIEHDDAVSGGMTSNVNKRSLPILQELRLLGLPKLLCIGADLPSLQKLTISQCPELKQDIFDSILQCARSTLTQLSLESCPKLAHVSPSTLPEKLERLEIRSCDQLTTVLGSSAEQSSSTSLPLLHSLRHLQLWNLPQLVMIGCNFPSLGVLEIKYCSRLPEKVWPKLKT